MRSDTVTHPTPEMREAMAKAEVGDDVLRDDPTTNRLESMAAEILGKEAALFVSSGTMGNQLAIMTCTQRGDEIIVSADSHIAMYEVGGAAVLSGVNMRGVTFENSIFHAEGIEANIREEEDIHQPHTALICLENALGNGRVVPLKNMQEIYRVAQSYGIPVHVDGARLFNAAAALDVDVKELTACCDSVSCCLSKGLGAPAGSILAGSKGFIECARKYRKMLGGGMRQTGILAAAGILALTRMTNRLKEDHENARYLAELLNNIPGVFVDMGAVCIDMVFAKVSTDEETIMQLPEMLAKDGILILDADRENVFRFVVSYEVTRRDIEYTAEKLAAILM